MWPPSRSPQTATSARCRKCHVEDWPLRHQTRNVAATNAGPQKMSTMLTSRRARLTSQSTTTPARQQPQISRSVLSTPQAYARSAFVQIYSSGFLWSIDCIQAKKGGGHHHAREKDHRE